MTAPSCAVSRIDPTLSVNEILKRCPASVRVLNAFGIDTCCGGAASLAEAAAEANIPVTDLLDAIEYLAADGGGAA